jgi:hypothetical protein
MTDETNDAPAPLSDSARVLAKTGREAGELWAEYEYEHSGRPIPIPTHKQVLADLLLEAGEGPGYVQQLQASDLQGLGHEFCRGAAQWFAARYLQDVPGTDAAAIVASYRTPESTDAHGAASQAALWLRELLGLTTDTPGEDDDPDGYFAPLASLFLLSFLLFAYDRERAAREEAERRVAEVRRTPLRKGTGAMRAMLKTDVHVTAARRRNQHAGRELTPQQVEARKLFRYEPLGWAERLVVHGLASLAREQGLLDSHPWATRPMLGQAPTRIRMAYPGASELGRVIGAKLDTSGKIPRETRRTIERALRSLCNVPRWIAMPVLVPSRAANGKPIEDIEVIQTLWIEASETLIDPGAYLSLHPAAVASHMRSYIEVPDLAAQYDAARRALGRAKMLDEWAIADDYYRSLALAQPGVGRRAVSSGPDGARETDGVLIKKIATSTLLRVLALEGFAKKHGIAKAIERARDANRFCVETGSLLNFEPTDGGWFVHMPHPDLRHVDAEQLVLLANDEAPPQ